MVRPGLRRRARRAAAAGRPVRRPQLRRGADRDPVGALRRRRPRSAWCRAPSLQVGVGASAGRLVDRRHAADRRPAAGRRRRPRRRSPPVPGADGDVAAARLAAAGTAGRACRRRRPWCARPAAGSGRRGCPGTFCTIGASCSRPADVVHLQLAAGDGRHRVDPARRRLEQQVGRRLDGRPGDRSRRAPRRTVQPSRVGGERPAAVRRRQGDPAGDVASTRPARRSRRRARPARTAAPSGGGGSAPQDTRSSPWTASS